MTPHWDRIASSIELEEGSRMKQMLAVVCTITTLSIIGCAGPTQQQPAAEQEPTATEEELITTMDFESEEAQMSADTSGGTEVEVTEAEADTERPQGD
jgi:hypothetical protein